jgi:hypothetical protein
VDDEQLLVQADQGFWELQRPDRYRPDGPATIPLRVTDLSVTLRDLRSQLGLDKPTS